MARITLTDIQPGDSINLTTTNNMITSITNGTGAGDIDGDNVRDGGLDERNFNDEAATLLPKTSSTRVLFSTDTSSGNISNSSVPTAPIEMPASTPVVTGPYVYDIGDSSLNQLIVKLSVYYESAALLVTKKFHFQIGYSTDWNGSTGTWTLIPETLRRANYRVSTTGMPVTGSLTIAHRFVENVDSSSLYFGFFVWHDATTETIQIEKANFYAITVRT